MLVSLVVSLVVRVILKLLVVVGLSVVFGYCEEVVAVVGVLAVDLPACSDVIAVVAVVGVVMLVTVDGSEGVAVVVVKDVVVATANGDMEAVEVAVVRGDVDKVVSIFGVNVVEFRVFLDSVLLSVLKLLQLML